jgi:hypothetical protein
MLKQIFSIFMLVGLAGCARESEESILDSFASRMGKDFSEHRATVVEASNITAFPDSGNAQKPQFFLKLLLEDKSCIIVATDVAGLISTDGKGNALTGLKTKGISYQFAHDALKQWPFSVFDLNRECLPAASADIQVVPASPTQIPSKQGG